MKMKAALLKGRDDMQLDELDIPEIDDNSVLVKVHACAVCGSDIRIFHSGNPRVSYPCIIGHEIAGEVVKAGANVGRFAVGDRVAVGADVPCGECSFCEAGIGNNCQTNYAIGYQYQGGFAQYLPLNAMTLNYGPVHRIPGDMSYEQAAMAEPLGCVLNALELSTVKLGDVAVVIGAGPIGCMMANVMKRMGAGKVILVQRSRPRLDRARQVVQADMFVCSSEEDAVEAVLDATGGLGADVVVTACPSGEAQQDALKMAKNRAFVNFFGGLPKEKENVLLNTNIIHYKELFVTGAHGALPRHHEKALELIASGTVDVQPFISHTYGMDRVGEAFEMAESHEGMRVVVKPQE